MEHFIECMNTFKLSKEVKSLLKNHFPNVVKGNDVNTYIKGLYERNVITQREYLFLETRVLISRYVDEIKNECDAAGAGIFLFHLKENKTYYVAGQNYPPSIRKYFDGNPPLFNCFDPDPSYYDERHIIACQDLEQEELFSPIINEIRADGVGSLLSHRLNYDGLMMGSYQIYFNEKNAITDYHIDYLLKKSLPLEKALYCFKYQMIEALKQELERSERATS